MSTPEYYHIAFAADRNFSVPLGLACLSLIQNAAPTSHYHIHVLGVDVDREVLTTLDEICEQSGHVISYYDVDSALRDVMKTEKFPSVAFGRFLLPDILPANVERVIYTDADVMICRDLAELYTIDMGDKLLGAIEELAPVWNKDFAKHHKQWAKHFGIAEEGSFYCYSGFLLFNLPACRQEKLSKRIMEQAVQHASKFAYPDQHVMNGVCEGRFLSLSQQYCVIPHLYAYYGRKAQEVLDCPQLSISAEELHQSATAPSILHFASSSKPFILFPPSGGNAPFYKLWRKSPWKHRIPYLPHRMYQGIKVKNSRSMRYLLRVLEIFSYIPLAYPIWWKLTNLLPESLLTRAGQFFNWTYPRR